MLVAFDDTDGPEGGCTTYLAGEILERVGPEHAAGRPRLVRLRPRNPYKTRGNAAVVLDLEEGLDPEAVLEAAFDVVRDHARVAEGKGAGVAVFQQPPEPAWYERGVREQVPLDEVAAVLSDVPTATLGTGRGLVGALCAAAWQPDRRERTFTRIGYRARERWGTPRQVAESSVRRIAETVTGAFDCWDADDAHAVMVPRTPCPVLYGLRSTDPEALAAPVALDGERETRATVFVTNQATDDHIAAEDLVPLQITDPPRALEGGHVRAVGKTPDGERLDLMAFEPTGRLREGLLDVDVGDTVLPVGGRRPGQVNLEKLLHVPTERVAATACPGCGGQMASMGNNAPRRCPRCGIRRRAETDRPAPVWHEADPSARRHLARPLALGLAEHVHTAAEALLVDEPGQARPSTTLT